MARKTPVVATTPTKDEAPMPEQDVETVAIIDDAEEPQAGANATPDELVALGIEEKLDQYAETIGAQLSDADKASKGDVEGTAFTLTQAAIGLLDLDINAFCRWKPGTNSGVDKAFRDIVNRSKPDYGPAMHELLTDACLLAVLSTDKKVAEQAREGNRDADDPQFTFVRKYVFPKKPAGRLDGVSDQKTAHAKLKEHAKDATDPREAAIFAEALAAVGDVDKLRTFGNKLASCANNRSRWMRWIYVPLVEEHIAAFKDQNRGNKQLGDVWIKTLSIARDAHGELAAAAQKAGEPIDAEALTATIKARVWDGYLDPLTRIGKADKADSGPTDTDKLADRIFRLLDELGTATSTENLSTMVQGAFASPPQLVPSTLPYELRRLLGQSPHARRVADKAREKSDREAAARQTAIVQQQATDAAAQAARADRQAQRTAQQTSGQTAGQAAQPQRRAVARPPSGDAAAAPDPRLAGLKKRNA